jgi:hypothetical protein
MGIKNAIMLPVILANAGTGIVYICRGNVKLGITLCIYGLASYILSTI